MKQVKIGHWPAMSVAAAIAEWEKLKAKRANGHDIAAEKRLRRAEEKAEVEAQRLARKIGSFTVLDACMAY